MAWYALINSLNVRTNKLPWWFTFINALIWSKFMETIIRALKCTWSGIWITTAALVQANFSSLIMPAATLAYIICGRSIVWATICLAYWVRNLEKQWWNAAGTSWVISTSKAIWRAGLTCLPWRVWICSSGTCFRAVTRRGATGKVMHRRILTILTAITRWAWTLIASWIAGRTQFIWWEHLRWTFVQALKCRRIKDVLMIGRAAINAILIVRACTAIAWRITRLAFSSWVLLIFPRWTCLDTLKAWIR